MLSAHCLEQSGGSDISAERHKSKANELEMLLSERDADNGDSAQQSKHEVHKSNLPPAEKHPKDIEKCRQTAVGRRIGHLFAEGTQRKEAKTPELDAERNSNNGAA